MAKNNAYIEKLRAKEQAIFDAGIDVGYQMAIDAMCITLNEQKVMGKNVFGVKRLYEVGDNMTEVSGEYKTAFTEKDDADYYRIILDERLKKIFGEAFQPFKVRYPAVKELKK